MLLTELSARTSQFGTDFIDVKLRDATGSVSGEYSRGREVSGWNIECSPRFSRTIDTLC